MVERLYRRAGDGEPRRRLAVFLPPFGLESRSPAGAGSRDDQHDRGDQKPTPVHRQSIAAFAGAGKR
jgi:hypothetical protein